MTTEAIANARAAGSFDFAPRGERLVELIAVLDCKHPLARYSQGAVSAPIVDRCAMCRARGSRADDRRGSRADLG
jgi:hypothetical protein